MSEQSTPEPISKPLHVVAGRYELVGLIGRGGMADVFEANDLLGGEVVALKRLRPVDDADRRRRSLELFEREFHVLSQVAHPRVVAAHDYGVEGSDPFYTMELLRGGDLHERTPIPWRAACTIARDVCSVFSLLHSRRLIYRDMSPRNVRLSDAGQAKVIDFGAMLPMGPTRQVVGTAAFCAPEAVALEALDGRTDLYALGATLYYVLAGRRAYPARDFRHLRELWLHEPRRLRDLGVSLPDALDELVMQMMSLDPALRPASAGEVMERLTALAGVPEDEQLLVPHAYLTTPVLVGRDRELARIRKKLAAALNGRGGALLFRGEPGSGRSRLLDTAALEAKLAGATVLRADSVDAQSGDYGVVRALCTQLLAAQPELAADAAAPYLALLGQLVPALREAQPELAPHDPGDDTAQRPALQAALRQWFAAVARVRPIVLVVDDIERSDEPSAAFLALLAYEASRCRLLICGSTRHDGSALPPALRLLSEASARLTLGRLTGAQTEALLRSVFGDVPHVQLLSTRLQRVAEGVPRNVLQVAQHLVDRGIVRYHAGAWSLPSRIDPSELPASMADALDLRIASLPALSRELAQAMASSPELRFTFEECRLLLAEDARGKVLSAIDALLVAEIAKIAGDDYAIAQEGWVPALLRSQDVAERARLQLRLAALFDRRGDRMRAAVAMMRGGEQERGLDALIEACRDSLRETDRDPAAFERLVRGVPADWAQWFELGLELCAKHGRGARDALVLKNRQTSLITPLTGASDTRALRDLVAELKHCVGVDIASQLDPGLPREERLKQTFARAQARHDALPESERTLKPSAALGQLARTMVSACGMVSVGHDHALLQTLPSLDVFMDLAPTMPVVEQLVSAIRARLTSRVDDARDAYQWQLDRLAQTDGGGFGASYSKNTRLGVLCALGLIEAAAGRRECLPLAQELEADAMYAVNGWITRMLYHAWLGQMREADRCRQRVELLRIQNSPNQYLEGGHLLHEVAAYAAAGDLTRVKQRIDEVEEMTRRFEGWQPIAHYTRGEYQRLRGDLPAALAQFDAGLALTGAGRHAAWVHLASGALQTLESMGHDEQVVARGEAYLQAAQPCRIGYLLNFIRLPLARALCQLGRCEPAAAHAQAAVDALLAQSSIGLQLGLACEVRARIASRARDAAGFEHFGQMCAEQYRLSENRALSARYERLVQEAKAAELAIREELLDAGDYSSTASGSLASQITSVMEGCQGPRERAQRCLELLVKRSRSLGGFLFTLVDQLPQVTSTLDDRELPERIERMVLEYLQDEMRAHGVTETLTATQLGDDHVDMTADWTSDAGALYRPIMLSHSADEGYAIVGVAVLRVDAKNTFVPPLELASDLSRFVYDQGDVSAFIAAAPPRRAP